MFTKEEIEGANAFIGAVRKTPPEKFCYFRREGVEYYLKDPLVYMAKLGMLEVEATKQIKELDSNYLHAIKREIDDSRVPPPLYVFKKNMCSDDDEIHSTYIKLGIKRDRIMVVSFHEDIKDIKI